MCDGKYLMCRPINKPFPLGVGVGVTVGVMVGVRVGVTVGVMVGVMVGVRVWATVGVMVGVRVWVTVGVTVGVMIGVMIGDGRSRRWTSQTDTHTTAARARTASAMSACRPHRDLAMLVVPCYGCVRFFFTNRGHSERYVASSRAVCSSKRLLPSTTAWRKHASACCGVQGTGVGHSGVSRLASSSPHSCGTSM